MTTPTIEDLAAALERLGQVAAGWLRDASWTTVGVVAGRLRDQWIALRVYVVTYEDRGEAPADLEPQGLNDIVAVRWGAPLADLQTILSDLSRGALEVKGLGRVALPLPLASVTAPLPHPEVSLRVLPSGWPHFRVEAQARAPSEIFDEHRVSAWDRELRVGGIDGVSGLLGLLDVDLWDREARCCWFCVAIPRYVAIASYRRDGDDLHVQLRATRPEKHPGAEVLVFATPQPMVLSRARLADLKQARPTATFWLTARVPPQAKPRIDLAEDGQILHSCVVQYQVPPPSPQLDDGSWSSYRTERAARLQEDLYLLSHGRKTTGRGPRFERIVHEVLGIAGLQPAGSIRVGGRQIDNAVVLDNRTLLIEATTVESAGYLDKVMGRFAELAKDAKCVLVVLGSPPPAQLKRAAKLRSVTFVTGDELRLFLGGVFRLTDLIRWRVRGLEVGNAFATIESFIESRPRIEDDFG